MITDINELKKGCKRWFNDNGVEIGLCSNKCGEMLGDGSITLCPICQAKLSQHQEDVEEFKKKIDELIHINNTTKLCFLKGVISRKLDEFLSSLNDDEVKEK